MNFENIPYEIIDYDCGYNLFFDQVLFDNTESLSKFKELITIHGIGLIYIIALLIRYNRSKEIYKKAILYLPQI